MLQTESKRKVEITAVQVLCRLLFAASGFFCQLLLEHHDLTLEYSTKK